jgi:hypothetical protein
MKASSTASLTSHLPAQQQLLDAHSPRHLLYCFHHAAPKAAATLVFVCGHEWHLNVPRASADGSC